MGRATWATRLIAMSAVPNRGQEHESAGDHGLHGRQWRQRQRTDVQQTRTQGDQPPHVHHFEPSRFTVLRRGWRASPLGARGRRSLSSTPTLPTSAEPTATSSRPAIISSHERTTV